MNTHGFEEMPMTFHPSITTAEKPQRNAKGAYLCAALLPKRLLPMDILDSTDEFSGRVDALNI
jgi:hypothetical protein